MANTVLLRKPLNIAQDAIQDYFDLFYELNSIEISEKHVIASLELSDTPGTNTKTIRLVYAPNDFATAQIEAYIALGYFLIKTQQVGKMTFAVLTLNGTVKVYKALLNQTGVDAPVLTVLKNTIGEIPSSAYSAPGIYFLNVISHLFTAKTRISYNSFAFDDNSQDVIVFKNSDTQIQIQSIAGDSLLVDYQILIEIYP